MPLKKMSYNTANKIFDLYCERLNNVAKLGRYKKYAYSDLNGYDVIDIANAMKLLAAYRVFNASSVDDSKITELKKYASEDSTGLIIYFSNFFPEDIANKLRRIDPEDEKGIIEYVHLTSDWMNSELFQILSKEETPRSFLDYCIDLGRTDPNYWGKVYDRLGITWETNDDKDLIYVLIRLGINFKSKENQ